MENFKKMSDSVTSNLIDFGSPKSFQSDFLLPLSTEQPVSLNDVTTIPFDNNPFDFLAHQTDMNKASQNDPFEMVYQSAYGSRKNFEQSNKIYFSRNEIGIEDLVPSCAGDLPVLEKHLNCSGNVSLNCSKTTITKHESSVLHALSLEGLTNLSSNDSVTRILDTSDPTNLQSHSYSDISDQVFSNNSSLNLQDKIEITTNKNFTNVRHSASALNNNLIKNFGASNNNVHLKSLIDDRLKRCIRKSLNSSVSNRHPHNEISNSNPKSGVSNCNSRLELEAGIKCNLSLTKPPNIVYRSLSEDINLNNKVTVVNLTNPNVGLSSRTQEEPIFSSECESLPNKRVLQSTGSASAISDSSNSLNKAFLNTNNSSFLNRGLLRSNGSEGSFSNNLLDRPKPKPILDCITGLVSHDKTSPFNSSLNCVTVNKPHLKPVSLWRSSSCSAMFQGRPTPLHQEGFVPDNAMDQVFQEAKCLSTTFDRLADGSITCISNDEVLSGVEINFASSCDDESDRDCCDVKENENTKMINETNYRNDHMSTPDSFVVGGLSIKPIDPPVSLSIKSIDPPVNLSIKSIDPPVNLSIKSIDPPVNLPPPILNENKLQEKLKQKNSTSNQQLGKRLPLKAVIPLGHMTKKVSKMVGMSAILPPDLKESVKHNTSIPMPEKVEKLPSNSRLSSSYSGSRLSGTHAPSGLLSSRTSLNSSDSSNSTQSSDTKINKLLTTKSNCGVPILRCSNTTQSSGQGSERKPATSTPIHRSNATVSSRHFGSITPMSGKGKQSKVLSSNTLQSKKPPLRRIFNTETKSAAENNLQRLKCLFQTKGKSSSKADKENALSK